jgi:zinc/manganese transport system permease protein
MNLLEYFEVDLFLWSWLGTSLLSLNFSIIGTTLVEKKMTLIGDTLSHALLPGVVLAGILLGPHPFSLLLGGWIAGFILIASTLLISRNAKIYQDSTFAFLSLFFVSIGLILSFKTKTSSEILHLLFGQVLSFDKQAFFIQLFLTFLTLGFFYTLRRVWSLWIVNPEFLQSQKFNPYLKFIVPFLSLTLFMTHLTFGLNSLGAFMTVGLMVIPSLIAQKLFDRLLSRVICAAFIGVLGSFFGFIFSVYFDVPIGPMVVIILSLSYLGLLVLINRGSTI